MPSYYEVLKLESNASVDFIEAAIDERYNEFRRLVNHHDPNVVEQANRALRQLEDIRSTLTNPEKRALYDQSLSFGGLADPTAILQGISSGTGFATPPPPKPAREDDPGLTAWKCSQCGKSNRVGSKTCSNCGNVLARECPNLCGSVVLLGEKYCSNCGKSVEEALGKLQFEFERAQKAFVDDLRSKIQSKRNELNRLSGFSNSIPMWGANQELNTLTGETVNTAAGCAPSLVIFIAASIVAGFANSLGGYRGNSGLAFIAFIVALILGSYIVREVVVKPRFQAVIERASHQRQEYIRHAERRLQEEQSKRFDPMAPKSYSPSSG